MQQNQGCIEYDGCLVHPHSKLAELMAHAAKTGKSEDHKAVRRHYDEVQPASGLPIAPAAPEGVWLTSRPSVHTLQDRKPPMNTISSMIPANVDAMSSSDVEETLTKLRDAGVFDNEGNLSPAFELELLRKKVKLFTALIQAERIAVSQPYVGEQLSCTILRLHGESFEAGFTPDMTTADKISDMRQNTELSLRLYLGMPERLAGLGL